MTFKQLEAILSAYGMYIHLRTYIRCAETKITIAHALGNYIEVEDDDKVLLIALELLCTEEQRTTLKTLGYLHDIQVEE